MLARWAAAFWAKKLLTDCSCGKRYRGVPEELINVLQEREARDRAAVVGAYFWASGRPVYVLLH